MTLKNYNFRYNQYRYFILGGILNNAISYSVYLILKRILNYGSAYLVAYTLGIIVAYYFNGYLVFKAKLTWARFVYYPCTYLIQYIFSYGLLNILITRIGIDENIAPLMIILMMIPFAFVMNKFIFNKK